MKDVCYIGDCVEVHCTLMVRLTGNSAQVCQKRTTDHCVQTQITSQNPFNFDYRILNSLFILINFK